MPCKDKKKRQAYALGYYQKNREHILRRKKQYYLENEKECKKQQQQLRQKKRTILHGLKIDGCAICGYNKCDAALDFHHVNPENRKFPVNFNHMTNKNLFIEVQKCILLCSNCHREIHAKERENNAI